MMRRLFATLGLAVAGCQGDSGTLSLSLTTAPNSTVLDTAQELHVTLTDPAQSFDVMRDGSGFLLEFDVDADGNDGTILIDALDGSGNLLAVGASPPLPIAALTSDCVIYMAAPLSFAASPISLSPAVSDLAAGALSYGAIFAGGVDATGAPSTEVNVYNVYDHSLTAGLELPTALGGIALGVGSTGYVYFFGGTDSTGAPTGDLERFDTTASPNGAYDDLGTMAALDRTDQAAIAIGDEQFIITGSPVVDVSGVDGTVVARTDITSLPPPGVTVTPATDGVNVTLVVGEGAGSGGLERLRADTFTDVPIVGAARTGHSVVAGLNATAIVIGGSLAGTPTADAIIIDAATSAATTITGALATPRSYAAVASTSRHLVVAGGTDATGAVVTTAEILDVSTLAHIATIPMVVPRTHATATALANGQVLIAGGVDANGAPTTILELFTPDDPPQ